MTPVEIALAVLFVGLVIKDAAKKKTKKVVRNLGKRRERAAIRKRIKQIKKRK